MSAQQPVALRSFIVFSGTGPILVLTNHAAITDPPLVDRLRHKGIVKFIAYEVPTDRVRERYGVPFEVIAADLAHRDDLRVLDFNGHHIFDMFSLAELGGPTVWEG